ncbi:PIG-L deacetylase family protein [Terriglobus roseus]|uniref:N-acetylglucosaminyl deacetylase, LmbE family n=1 Tax=Terriglobus roseus TaxID=392734 RepID=A0A1H4LM34_9BACT|nr:PIG-L deacetylase family protein [Terriglobus roseus]SEB71743.1 N-acetylglucosaminyl deacetylase, LmbE family [Terriglobus roseus]
MIISIIDDQQWLTTLTQVPAWTPLPLPALVVAPHPDDETLGAGALIATLRAQGIPVTVVAVTDGENAYDTSPEEREHLRRVREREQAEALQELGVRADSVHRLRLTDSGLMERQEELTRLLLGLARDGMQIIAPWSGDFHPDHMACAHAAESVANAKGLPLVSYFFWTWHRGTIDLLAGLPMGRFVPDAAALRAKSDALACHRSQLDHSSGEPILPDRLLGPARWPFEVFLQG